MDLTITTASAAILGLWLLILSANVVRGRRGAGASIGDGGDETLERRIRAQGNLAEYAPLFLILLAVLEIQSANSFLLGVIALMFVAGRLMHGYCFSFTTGSPSLRMGGMILTFTALALISLFALVQTLFL